MRRIAKSIATCLLGAAVAFVLASCAGPRHDDRGSDGGRPITMTLELHGDLKSIQAALEILRKDVDRDLTCTNATKGFDSCDDGRMDVVPAQVEVTVKLRLESYTALGRALDRIEPDAIGSVSVKIYLATCSCGMRVCRNVMGCFTASCQRC